MNEPSPLKKKRFAPVVWGASALAAAVLVLGVTGTLSSWTTAVIGNTDNSVASTKAVSLSESSGGTQCVDTADTSDNTAQCTTINKYGGTTTALDPDGTNTRSVTVTLKNTGTESGDLTLKASACGSTAVPTSTGADPVRYPLCGRVLVALSCTGAAAAAPYPEASLTDFELETTPRTITTLGADESTACTFALRLPTDTPAGYASQVAAQVLTWTLAA